MREIRSRISQRHGIELTTQQIQELAARRLEAILDPRTVKPSLLEQIRRSTSTPVDAPPSTEPAYTFEDTTIYDTPRGSLQFIRRLLNPILKLFFNPNPLISALHTQVTLNQAAAQREAERDRRQAEWNALHYEILQRLVLEIARTSLDAQQLAMRVEALSAKVDFAERRARSIEGTLHQSRPAPRHSESAPPPPVPQVAQQAREVGSGPTDVTGAPVAQEGNAAGTVEGGRRRRRRRRGRRPQGFTPEGVAGEAAGAAFAEPSRASEAGDTGEMDEPDEDDGGPDVGGDEGDSAFAEAPPAIVETASMIVETMPAPVPTPAEPPSPAMPVTETYAPVETAAPQTPSAESVEPVAPELSDRPQPPDTVGD
jgi:hypothetical protein